MITHALQRARRSAATGNDSAAKSAYLDILLHQPDHLHALMELGALAYAGGHVSAARTAFQQAVHLHPTNLTARVGYGDLLFQAGDPDAACQQYRTALAIDPSMPRAHQGLARALSALGRDAGPHWSLGFSGHAVEHRRFRGTGTGVNLLLLVAATGGNLETRAWIDDRTYAVTAVHAEYFEPGAPLPPFAIVVNAIGDADLCRPALDNAERILAHIHAPVINPPAGVRATGRQDIARRMAGIPGVVTPRIAPLSQVIPTFPLLLRAPGFHTGQHFIRVDRPAALAEAAASLPCRDPLAITWLDATGPDGMARKYRVMFIDGIAYPLHLAISAHWKVHYFTAAMATNPAFRAEEQRFLSNMPAVLGAPAMAALAAIRKTLNLDFGGVDFGIGANGSLLLFEANAAMLIPPPDPDPMWNYRRPSLLAATRAARHMLVRRITDARP